MPEAYQKAAAATSLAAGGSGAVSDGRGEPERLGASLSPVVAAGRNASVVPRRPLS